MLLLALGIVVLGLGCTCRAGVGYHEQQPRTYTRSLLPLSQPTTLWTAQRGQGLR